MGYDPSADVVVDAAPECILSGKNSQNALYGLLRSYNGGPVKAELSRHTPSQNNPAICRGLRFEMHEIPFAIDALQKLYNMMQQRGSQPQPGQVLPVNQRPHPDMVRGQQQAVAQQGYAPQQGYQAPQQGFQAPQNPYGQQGGQLPPPPGGFNPQGGNGGMPPQQPF